MTAKGYTDKLHVLLRKVVEKLATFKIDPKRFEILKELVSNKTIYLRIRKRRCLCGWSRVSNSIVIQNQDRQFTLGIQPPFVSVHFEAGHLLSLEASVPNVIRVQCSWSQASNYCKSTCVSSFAKVGGFPRVLRFPPPVKSDRHDMTLDVESGVKPQSIQSRTIDYNCTM